MLHAYQSAESIHRKYKFNITRSSVKKHETLLQKMHVARCKRAKACFSSMSAARNARLARCLIKSVAIVNKSVQKPPLNIHTQNSDAQKLRYETCPPLNMRARAPFLSVIYRCISRPRRKKCRNDS